MPTLGAHFSEKDAGAINAAAASAPEKKVGPYIATAVLERLKREGMLPGSKRAENIAMLDELGDDAVAALFARELRRNSRKTAA